MQPAITSAKRRLALVAALASIAVAGAVAVSDSSAAVPASTATPNELARIAGPRITQHGEFGWQTRCPATNSAAR